MTNKEIAILLAETLGLGIGSEEQRELESALDDVERRGSLLGRVLELDWVIESLDDCTVYHIEERLRRRREKLKLKAEEDK